MVGPALGCPLSARRMKRVYSIELICYNSMTYKLLTYMSYDIHHRQLISCGCYSWSSAMVWTMYMLIGKARREAVAGPRYGVHGFTLLATAAWHGMRPNPARSDHLKRAWPNLITSALVRRRCLVGVRHRQLCKRLIMPIDLMGRLSGT